MRGPASKRCVERLSARGFSNFLPLYDLAKRCFPVTDVMLALMLCVDRSDLWRWKTGRRNPSRPVRRLLALLILWRIGRLVTAYDILYGPASKNLPQLVDAWEAEQAAKSETKVDTSTVLRKKRTKKPVVPTNH